MAVSRGWEREFLNAGFSQVTIAFLRDIEIIAQPGTISLDVNEIEALMHEFRLIRNELDVLRKGIAENSIPNLPTQQMPVDSSFPDLSTKQIPIVNNFYSLATSTDMTAKSYQFIAATSKVTIKLPEVPASNDIVTVVNVNGNQVTVDGNTNLINGETSTVSTRKNTTINYHYFKDLGAWYMR